MKSGRKKGGPTRTGKNNQKIESKKESKPKTKSNVARDGKSPTDDTPTNLPRLSIALSPNNLLTIYVYLTIFSTRKWET